MPITFACACGKTLKVAAEEDDGDERPRKKRRKKSRRKPAEAGPSARRRTFSLVGGLVAVVGGCGLAYFARESNERRVGRVIGLGVASLFGGIGAIFRGLTGNYGDPEVAADDD